MFGLVVRFELREGHEEAFDRLVSETLGKIATEEAGTLLYIAHTVQGSPAARLFYELYEDETAFQSHEENEHVRRFLSERAQHLLQEPQVTFVSSQIGLARDGIDLDGS